MQTEKISVLQTADNVDEFGLYMFLLRAANFFVSQTEVVQATWRHMVSGGPLDVMHPGIPSIDSLQARRNIVAFTWPDQFQRPVSQDSWRRSKESLARDVLVNFASISRRWWATHEDKPVVVDGHGRLELGRALQIVGPRAGLHDDHVSPFLRLEPQPVTGNDLNQICGALHLRYTDAADVAHGHMPIPGPADGDDAHPGGGQWVLDADSLSRDLIAETRLRQYAEEIAEQMIRNSPRDIHNKRMAPFGPPPLPGSKYYSLFRFLDGSNFERAKVPIEEIRRRYEERLPTGEGLTPTFTLPSTALKSGGWWSNPKGNSLGSQPQRRAWKSAGFNAHPTVSKDAAGQTSITHVTFHAVPGRQWWHPMRHKLWTGDMDAWDRRAYLEQVALQRGWFDHRWFHGPPELTVRQYMQSVREGDD